MVTLFIAWARLKVNEALILHKNNALLLELLTKIGQVVKDIAIGSRGLGFISGPI